MAVPDFPFTIFPADLRSWQRVAERVAGRADDDGEMMHPNFAAYALALVCATSSVMKNGD
jgi:hypothetical protein